MADFLTIDYPFKLIGVTILRYADYGTALKDKGLQYKRDDFSTGCGDLPSRQAYTHM